jgi:hypothetical protein
MSAVTTLSVDLGGDMMRYNWTINGQPSATARRYRSSKANAP